MATEWSDDITVVDLEDEPALSEELNTLIERFEELGDAQGPHLVVNLSNVTYVNSSNIAQFLQLKKKVEDRGLRLRLCAVGPDVRSVMTVTGLDKVFSFAPDTLTALAGLQMDMESNG